MTVKVLPKRGAVYWITLNYINKPAASGEKHMVVVVQSNEILKQAREVNVLEITSNLRDVNARYMFSFQQILSQANIKPLTARLNAIVKCNIEMHQNAKCRGLSSLLCKPLFSFFNSIIIDIYQLYPRNRLKVALKY